MCLKLGLNFISNYCTFFLLDLGSRAKGIGAKGIGLGVTGLVYWTRGNGLGVTGLGYWTRGNWLWASQLSLLELSQILSRKSVLDYNKCTSPVLLVTHNTNFISDSHPCTNWNCWLICGCMTCLSSVIKTFLIKDMRRHTWLYFFSSVIDFSHFFLTWPLLQPFIPSSAS